MGNLIKPAEYAKKLGISRQAVYAKIKKGILTSKSVDGKLYIVQHEADRMASPTGAGRTPSTRSSQRSPEEPSKDFRDLLEAKDETIGILKETIVDLKDTNKMITSTLRGEVELLKEAFSEMKMLYSTRIEHLQTEEATTLETAPTEIASAEEGAEEQAVEFADTMTILDEAGTVPDDVDAGDDLAWIELEDFFDEHDIRKKTKQAKVTKQLKKLFKKGDSRVDSFNGDLILLAEADFRDVLKKKKA